MKNRKIFPSEDSAVEYLARKYFPARSTSSRGYRPQFLRCVIAYALKEGWIKIVPQRNG